MSRQNDERMAIGSAVYQYMLQRGLQPHQAAAIAGNMAWESGGRHNTVNWGDNAAFPNAPHSFGIAQWNGQRLANLVGFARQQGIDIPQGNLADQGYMQRIAQMIPLQTQIEFAHNEMQGPERRAWDRIAGAPNLQDAAAGAIGYHRPAGYTNANPAAGHGFSDRLSLADNILRQGGVNQETHHLLPGEQTPPPLSPPPAVANNAPAPPPALNLTPSNDQHPPPNQNQPNPPPLGPPQIDQGQLQNMIASIIDRRAQQAEQDAEPQIPFGPPRARPRVALNIPQMRLGTRG